MRPACAYCSDDATGFDMDGAFTCGDTSTCMPVAAPFHRVFEVSGSDEECPARLAGGHDGGGGEEA